VEIIFGQGFADSCFFTASTVVKPEDTAAYVTKMNELDAVRSDRVRQRALDVVKDQETAKVSFIQTSSCRL
jgi:hypothetical protein